MSASDARELTASVSRKNSAEAHLPPLSISPAIGVAELLREFVTDGCLALVIFPTVSRRRFEKRNRSCKNDQMALSRHL
jgi:hypothetical protein